MTDYRTPERLSPSSLARWEGSPDEFFLQYIVPKDIRPDKQPQTGPMSVGSAFDALVKNSLYKRYFGEQACLDDAYRLRDLVVAQCQDHTLPESLVIASDVFEQYTECGALENLIKVIDQSSVAPRMEFDVVAVIGGVPVLGKPDLHFHGQRGGHVITDWKVSGSVSNWGVSPQQGFQVSLDISGTKSSGLPHKKYIPVQHPCGLEVSGVPMNETTDYWADQLTTYAWALGEPVGSQDYIVRIEQLACRPPTKTSKDDRLKVKSVVHQSTVDATYQQQLLERYQRCWHHVTTGHYFPDLSLSDSVNRANMLVRSLTQTDIATLYNDTTIPKFDWNLS